MRYSPLLLVVAFAVISFVSAAPTGQAIKTIEQPDVNDNNQLIEGLVQSAGDEAVNTIAIADDENDTLRRTKPDFLVVDSSPSDSRHKKFLEEIKSALPAKSILKFIENGCQSFEQIKTPPNKIARLALEKLKKLKCPSNSR